MVCDKCGAELKAGEEYCPFCGEATVEKETIATKPSEKSGITFETYKINQEKLKANKFNNYLIFSIIETLICFLPTGFISLILLELKLKKLIFEDKFEEAKRMKLIIKILLISGIILGLATTVVRVSADVLEFLLETEQCNL